MSTKSQHVQDSTIAERRLRPIYDWLDSGNNKKALQECDKVLKKTPNLLCAKALKALTFHRLGRQSESLDILYNLEALVRQKLGDDATLQAMSLCYREMQYLDKICKLYETAVKLDPTNEELQTHLFMSHVRVGDFKSQQQVAMTLYKHKPKNPYYCWAVMSIVLQARRGEGATDPKKCKLLLSLAERMMDKLVSDNKLEAEQEVQLFMMILEMQEKYEEILILLEGPLGAKLTMSEAESKLVYLVALKRWDELNMVCKNFLAETVDHWVMWKHYLQSVFELMPKNQNTMNHHENHESSGDAEIETADDTPEKAHEFICRTMEIETEHGYILRAPYLARFELGSKLIENNIDPSELLGDLIELFIEYFRTFGHKPCCVLDLKMYLHLLDSEKRLELASRLIKDVGISTTSVPETEAQMQKHIGALQLSRLCGSHRDLSPEHLKALVTALWLHYQHGHDLYGVDLLPTELGPSDAYALLAVHVLYDLAQSAHSSDYMVSALVVLEALLKNSPYNFHGRLLAIRLYHALGNVREAQEAYTKLDIKHIQLDSLGYIHCGRLPTTGLFYLCSSLFDATLKFFSQNYKDSTDHLTLNYKFGSFLKVEEFMDFRERVNNSLFYATVAVDRIIVNLVECMSTEVLYTLNISPRDHKIDWDSLIDNNDRNVIASWDPEVADFKSDQNPDFATLFEQDMCFLKLRTQILWTLSDAVGLVTSPEGDREKYVEALRLALNDWEILESEVRLKKFVPLSQLHVTSPLPSRLHAALDSPYLGILNKFFQTLISISSDYVDRTTTFKSEIQTALNLLIESVEHRTKKDPNDFQERRKAMEIVVNSVEIISVSCLICLLCNDLVKPPSQGKKGKKKGTDDCKSRDVLKEIINGLKSATNSLSDVLENWPKPESDNVIGTLVESLNLGTNGDSVRESIVNSQNHAVKEIQNVLKNKIKMLNRLIG